MRTLLVVGMLMAGSVGVFAQNVGEGRARTDRDAMRVASPRCDPYTTACRPGWWTVAWHPDIGSRWTAPYGFEIRIIGAYYEWEPEHYGEVVYVATFWRTWEDEPSMQTATLVMLPSWFGRGVWEVTQ